MRGIYNEADPSYRSDHRLLRREPIWAAAGDVAGTPVDWPGTRSTARPTTCYQPARPREQRRPSRDGGVPPASDDAMKLATAGCVARGLAVEDDEFSRRLLVRLLHDTTLETNGPVG